MLEMLFWKGDAGRAAPAIGGDAREAWRARPRGVVGGMVKGDLVLPAVERRWDGAKG